jgi:PLP dependent protein
MTGVSELGTAEIGGRIRNLRARIAAAAQAAGRDPESIGILAVSKLQPVAAIRAGMSAGLTDFGENFLQEALAKMDELGPGPARWHFIGSLQSNKTSAVAERFDWVHSLDREKIAIRLSRQRPPGMPPLNVCVQVRIGEEASKSGVEPVDAARLARRVAELPGLRLRGLMAVPPPETDSARQRAWCQQLRELFAAVQLTGLEMDTLSMGMSDDLEAAIAEGSTLLRIGTAIFGPRPGQA